jgi:adenylate kinase
MDERKMYKLFLVGGANGVGKTSLTILVSLELDLTRLETGKVLSEYLTDKSLIGFKDYVTQRIFDNEQDLILDTHFAQYSPYACKPMPFERGLEADNLSALARKFDIYLCRLELNPEELLQRRLNDLRRRVKIPALIVEELGFNRKASALYSEELGKPVFSLENNDFDKTKSQLEDWIKISRRNK